jgi:hypothetical protein
VNGQSPQIALFLQAATLVVYSVWLFGLTKAGELDTRTTGTSWSSEREKDLQRQLDSLERLIVATSKGDADNLEHPDSGARADRTRDLE